MQVTLKYNPDEPLDRKEAEKIVKCTNSYIALWDIQMEVFRPARKHKYTDENIQELVDKIGEDAETLIGLLENKYIEILKDNNVIDLLD